MADAGGGQLPLSDDDIERPRLFAVSSRYPGHTSATPEGAAKVVQIAGAVLDWVAGVVNSG